MGDRKSPHEDTFITETHLELLQKITSVEDELHGKITYKAIQCPEKLHMQ